jgi:hypothetical protein
MIERAVVGIDATTGNAAADDDTDDTDDTDDMGWSPHNATVASSQVALVTPSQRARN